MAETSPEPAAAEATSAPPPVRTILQVFYAENCGSCGAELPLLAKMVEHNTVELVIMVMGNRDKGYAALKKVSPRLVEIASVAPAGEEHEMLRAAGSADGKLPYARTLLSTGLVCQTWSGGLTSGVLDRMLESCRLKSEGLQGSGPGAN
jgi:hypothetical protein